MHFVDDEHLVAVPHRHERQAVDDHVADVLHAGVSGGVDLEHVDVASFGDLPARIADPARIGGRPVRAAQRARQDAGRRGLAHTARAGKHEGLRNPLGRNRVLQRARHRRLADDIVELLRAPLAGEDLVGHRL